MVTLSALAITQKLQEVVWENVRCLPGGECVSVDGTHLGHNIPASRRDRFLQRGFRAPSRESLASFKTGLDFLG